MRVGTDAPERMSVVSGELHAVSYYWEWDYIQYSVIGIDGRVRRTVNVDPLGVRVRFARLAIRRAGSLARVPPR